MINSINLLTLRNAEFLQYMSDFSSLVENNDPALLNVATQHTALKTKVGEIEQLFKTSRASTITKELTELDEKRDQAINGISTVIDGFGYYFDASKSEPAGLLSAHLKEYGAGIYRLNYQAETAILEEIVSDWENKPELLAALTTLGLVDWKDELKANNAAFNQRYLARTQEYGAASPETLKGKRDETMAAYYELRKFLEAYATIDSANPLYTKTINELNALIEQYNTMLASRATSSDGNTEEGSSQEEDTTDIKEEVTPVVP